MPFGGLRRSRILAKNAAIVESNGGRKRVGVPSESINGTVCGAGLTVGVGVVELPRQECRRGHHGVVCQGCAEPVSLVIEEEERFVLMIGPPME